MRIPLKRTFFIPFFILSFFSFQIFHFFYFTENLLKYVSHSGGSRGGYFSFNSFFIRPHQTFTQTYSYCFPLSSSRATSVALPLPDVSIVDHKLTFYIFSPFFSFHFLLLRRFFIRFSIFIVNMVVKLFTIFNGFCVLRLVAVAFGWIWDAWMQRIEGLMEWGRE